MSHIYLNVIRTSFMHFHQPVEDSSILCEYLLVRPLHCNVVIMLCVIFIFHAFFSFFIRFHGTIFIVERVLSPFCTFVRCTILPIPLSSLIIPSFCTFVRCTILPVPLSSLIIPSYAQFIISMFYFLLWFLYVFNFADVTQEAPSEGENLDIFFVSLYHHQH